MILAGYIVIAIFGLVLGSFAGATVWRLRARQLVGDKKAGEPYDKQELKTLLPLTKETVATDRSRCLHCGHELAATDLVPLLSWLSTKGKCRYCKKRIGSFEPLIEIGTAISFVVLFHAWNLNYGVGGLDIALLVAGLVSTLLLVILFAYDAKWFILPDVIVFPLIAIGVLYAGYAVIGSSSPFSAGISLLASLMILGGLYFGLWFYSKGQWVGFGDVKLGVALGLLLVDWKLAFLALFLANLIGTLIVIPGLLRRTMGRQTQIPFGPLLIAGFAISASYGEQLITWYEQASMWLIALVLMV